MQAEGQSDEVTCVTFRKIPECSMIGNIGGKKIVQLYKGI